jgi:hypothetical protein
VTTPDPSAAPIWAQRRRDQDRIRLALRPESTATTAVRTAAPEEHP